MSRKGQALTSPLTDFMTGYLVFIDVFPEVGFKTSESVREVRTVYSRIKYFLSRT